MTCQTKMFSEAQSCQEGGVCSSKNFKVEIFISLDRQFNVWNGIHKPRPQVSALESLIGVLGFPQTDGSLSSLSRVSPLIFFELCFSLTLSPYLSPPFIGALFSITDNLLLYHLNLLMLKISVNSFLCHSSRQLQK